MLCGWGDKEATCEARVSGSSPGCGVNIYVISRIQHVVNDGFTEWPLMILSMLVH